MTNENLNKKYLRLARHELTELFGRVLYFFIVRCPLKGYRYLKTFSCKFFKYDLLVSTMRLRVTQNFSKGLLNPFTANPIKRSHTLKKFVCLTILLGWRLKGLTLVSISLTMVRLYNTGIQF